MNRVVVTGFGVVSALGPDKVALADALATVRGGVGPVSLFDTAGCRCHAAAQAAAVSPGAVSRADAFLALATAEALADAGLAGGWRRLRVFQGTAHGALDCWERGDDPGQGQPVRLGRETWESLAEQVSVTTHVNACVASTWAVGMALAALRRGETDLALVAGAETLSAFLFRGFDALRALTPTCCRPFDQRRDGLVLGEGAAVLVLESEARARHRGAPIRAELAGFGAAADANHLTAPDLSGRGAAAALRRALADARVSGAPDYINLHGTGTPHNDRMELHALHRAFAHAVAAVAVSGTKAMTGHTSGAAGVIELAICLCALDQGLIPATLGLEEPDGACGAVDLVAGEPRRQGCDHLVSINSAFGGNNAAVVLRRWS